MRRYLVRYCATFWGSVVDGPILREDMCMMMFGCAFSQNGEIERASRCRGYIDMLYEATVSFMRWRQPHRSRYGVKRHISKLDVAAAAAGLQIVLAPAATSALSGRQTVLVRLSNRSIDSTYCLRRSPLIALRAGVEG